MGEDTPIKELEEAYSNGFNLTQHQANYVLCSLDDAERTALGVNCANRRKCKNPANVRWARLTADGSETCQNPDVQKNIARAWPETSVSCTLTLDSCPENWVSWESTPDEAFGFLGHLRPGSFVTISMNADSFFS